MIGWQFFFNQGLQDSNPDSTPLQSLAPLQVLVYAIKE